MAFGRRRGSLIRTAAHTAVIASTANAVTGRQSRRQLAAAQQAAQQQQEQAAQQQAAVPVAPPMPDLPSDDVIAKIERLAKLHASGALTDEEFNQLKARALS